MATSISQDAILSMLQPLDTESKRWMAGKLYEQVGGDEMILVSNAYRKAVDDVLNSRATVHDCSEDLFKAFGI